MEITDILKQIGLTDKEAGVYLALLELGTATVHPIATKAGIKRPTTYLILEQLQQKGMVSVVPRATKALFTAESPEKILTDINKKQELIKRFLPNMLALYNEKKEKPQIQLFEGREGVREVYRKIYSANSVYFFGTVKEAEKYDPEALYAFVDRAAKMNFSVRDLLTHSAEDIAYAKKARLEKNYEIKFLPEGWNFLTDNAIFGDNVVFFSFHPQIFAVVICSKEIALAIRTLFEFSWQAADTYEQVIVNHSALKVQSIRQKPL